MCCVLCVGCWGFGVGCSGLRVGVFGSRNKLQGFWFGVWDDHASVQGLGYRVWGGHQSGWMNNLRRLRAHADEAAKVRLHVVGPRAPDVERPRVLVRHHFLEKICNAQEWLVLHCRTTSASTAHSPRIEVRTVQYVSQCIWNARCWRWLFGDETPISRAR